tara:strand:+ start:6699 stop:7094 length:396 start_codon:yes stop_codon:yes gene_type:complete
MSDERIRFRGLTSGEVIINKPESSDGDEALVHANNISDTRNLSKYFSGALSTNNDTSNTNGTRRIIWASGKIFGALAIKVVASGDAYADGAATVGALDKIKTLYIKNTGQDSGLNATTADIRIYTSLGGGG